MGHLAQDSNYHTMKHSISKQIVFDYLAGRSTPLEKRTIETWLIREENVEEFHQWLYEWERQSPQYVPDSETAFSALSEKIENQVLGQSSQAINHRYVSRWRTFRFWQIAASITILLGISAWLLREPILYKTYQTDYAQSRTFLLSDGSRVTLNANSTLTVPRFGFGAEVREVWLKGEAEFSVRHTLTHQRFVVKISKHFQVEVLGTEFTVFARPRGTKVALSEGKIRLDYKKYAQRKQLLMQPGELVTLSPSGNLKLQRTERPELQSAWKEQRYVFDNTSVREICAILLENFGLVVVPGNEATAARTISGNFKAQNANDLLDVLREVLDLDIREQNGSIILNSHESNSKPI